MRMENTEVLNDFAGHISVFLYVSKRGRGYLFVWDFREQKVGNFLCPCCLAGYQKRRLLEMVDRETKRGVLVGPVRWLSSYSQANLDEYGLGAHFHEGRPHMLPRKSRMRFAPSAP